MNYQNLKYWLFIAGLIINTHINAQTSTLVNDLSFTDNQSSQLWEDVPPNFKEIEINKIIKIDAKHSKIFYTKNDTQFEAVINSNQKNPLLIASCEEVNIDRLPKAVKNIFDTSRYGVSEIQKVFITSTPNSDDFYRIDINYKNQNLSLFYNNLGRYHKPPY